MDQLQKKNKTPKNANVAVFGDGLSVERMRDAKRLRCFALTATERLEQLFESPQEFHKSGVRMEEVFDEYMCMTSVCDRGTLFHLKQYLRKRSMSADVMSHFPADWDFLEEGLCNSCQDVHALSFCSGAAGCLWKHRGGAGCGANQASHTDRGLGVPALSERGCCHNDFRCQCYPQASQEKNTAPEPAAECSVLQPRLWLLPRLLRQAQISNPQETGFAAQSAHVVRRTSTVVAVKRARRLKWWNASSKKSATTGDGFILHVGRTCKANCLRSGYCSEDCRQKADKLRTYSLLLTQEGLRNLANKRWGAGRGWTAHDCVLAQRHD
ncbi:hypothetical protein CAPTEDRAFT_218278 [Capitella teleta]|uniref:DUF6589 domain-containing protein n=1 Tax=Capitella teleta TaxID=283909 RepID=R7V3Z6_CAPTE|nr:hypothetical protein CAPTEDRAFT_218278 [Capitella teleta]|eukprot:ELU13578.1 hypothetical protein CAPTEDRAFT_218278 [Capitella teleta]